MKENNWIDIKDELPEEDGKYIIYDDSYKEVYTMEFRNGAFGAVHSGLWETDEDITHWQNLPEPPHIE